MPRKAERFRDRQTKADRDARATDTVCRTCGDAFAVMTEDGVMWEQCRCGWKRLTPDHGPLMPAKGWLPLGHR